MKKGLCCFVTPAKLKTQWSLKFAFEKKEIDLSRFEVSWRPWFELQIRFYINIQLFIFFKSPLHEENVAEHKSRSLVLVRQWKLPNQRCRGQCMEHHPHFFMAVNLWKGSKKTVWSQCCFTWTRMMAAITCTFNFEEVDSFFRYESSQVER